MKLVTEPIQPVVVTVIGGTGTGDGGQGAPLTSGTVATTPDSQPNLVLRVVAPMVAILVRAVYTFLESLSGLIVAGGVITKAIPAGDFLQLLQVCAGLSVGITVVGIIRNTATVFSGLEKKFPLGSGSV